MRILISLFLVTIVVCGSWITQNWPEKINDPILYQINTEPQSLILQADGLVNHE